MGSVDTGAATSATAAQEKQPAVPAQCTDTIHVPTPNPAPAVPPAWDTHEVNWGTAAMEDLGCSWPAPINQKSKHRDLSQHCREARRSQKPLPQAPMKPGNTAPPHSSPSRQKRPRTEKCFTWGRLLHCTRECSSMAQGSCRYHCCSDKWHVPDPGQSCYRSRQESSTPPKTATVLHPRHMPARHGFTRVLETSQAVSFYFLKKENKKPTTPPQTPPNKKKRIP